MIFKYTMKFIDKGFEEYEIEGIIFAENFWEAANKLITVYGEADLAGYQIDFVDDGEVFEF